MVNAEASKPAAVIQPFAPCTTVRGSLIYLALCVLGMEPRALHVVDSCSITLQLLNFHTMGHTASQIHGDVLCCGSVRVAVSR